ncbi:MAG: SCO1664 family protein [Chloroflexota bacterium]
MESISSDLYQPGGRAWQPNRPDIIHLLSSATHASIQPIYWGSNHTFLVTLDAGDQGQSLAVYKPARGEYPLYDFSSGSLYRREVATWLVNALLGWAIVPPTVAASGVYGNGSVQLFIESPATAEVEVYALRRVALLDALVNNADRKSEHCIASLEGDLFAIDHGLTFHVQPKLRTFLWHFAGQQFSRREIRDLKRLHTALDQQGDPCATLLEQQLTRPEWRALRERLDRMLASGSFPNPRNKPVPYHW